LAEVVDDESGPVLSLRAVAAAVDGSVTLRRSLTGPVDRPVDVGNAVAALLVEDGASELVPRRLPAGVDRSIDPTSTREGDK
jgi:hydroxymethylbilane synthase